MRREAIKAEWPVNMADVFAARRVIQSILEVPTPLRFYKDLSIELGCKIFVKHENHLPTQAFKVRGGVTRVAYATDEEQQRGFVTASRGNHGQSLAFAGNRACIPVTVMVPIGNNPEKNAAIKSFGAKVIESGSDYDECRQLAQKMSLELNGPVFVDSVEERWNVAGVATAYLEILEQQDIDTIIVPVGGGSSAAGALTVVRALAPKVEVYGVQASQASAITQSWRKGQRIETLTANTFADGVATKHPYDFTFRFLVEGLDDMVTCSELEIADAVKILMRVTHNLVEGAGALAFAGARKLFPSLKGKSVAVVLTGGNIDLETLKTILTGTPT